jgi:CheY-like chemotaxis protein/HPt (histidine-containing phosphotransfer) domain-containing protein
VLRIFVVSSIDEAREALGVMIRALGWTPRALGTVAQLADTLRDTPPNDWPDVLIFEAHPQDTGMQRLIAGLETEWSHGELPPVIVVADVIRADMPKTRSPRGHDATLARPVTSSALFNAITSAVWKRGGRHDRSLQSTHFNELQTQSLAGVRALVVDDSEINVEVAKRILEKQGAIVTSCSDGRAAVEAVRAQHLQLDIVLMDVQMPNIDGNEATRRIRNDLGIKTLPIMALTAGALMAERQRSIEAGMNEFITKPFEPLALIRKVRHLVEQARGAPIPLVIRDSRPATAAGAGSFMTCIDAATVQRLFGDDMPLFKSLLGRMLREFSDLALPVSVHDQASRNAAMARVHKLKGSAGMIGALHVMRFAGAAEKALQQTRPVEVVDTILRQLASALTTLAEDARPLLAENIATADIASPAAGAADRPSDSAFDIRGLQTLLEAQNLAALDGLNALSGALSGLLDKVSFDALRAAVEDLNFPRAALLLREALDEPAKAVSVR